MTIHRIYSHKCANGHDGEQKTSENDAPYTPPEIREYLTGMHRAEVGFDCDVCQLPMVQYKDTSL